MKKRTRKQQLPDMFKEEVDDRFPWGELCSKCYHPLLNDVYCTNEECSCYNPDDLNLTEIYRPDTDYND